MSAVVEAPAVQRVQSAVAELPALAESIVVDSPESYIQAGELVKLCGEREALVKRELDPLREKAHATWKGLVAKIAELCAPAQQARKAIGAKMAAYDRDQERKRWEAEAAAEAERQRLAAESEAKLAAAFKAEQEGKGDEAAAELESAVQAATAPAPVARYVPPAPKVQGVAMRSYWSAEVVDFRALVEFVAEEIHGHERVAAVLDLLSPNMEVLNREARSLKRADLGIPGVRGVERREPARTGR